MNTKQALIKELIVEALGECNPIIMNEIAWEIVLLAAAPEDEA